MDRGRHLYLLQASTGPIKVGRSGSPEKRRRGIETSGGRPVSLVAVMEGAGEREGELLALLAPYRTQGEWVQNRVEARRIIAEFWGTPITFPHPAGALLPRSKPGKREAEEAQRRTEFEAAINSLAADIMGGRFGRRRKTRATSQDADATPP